MLKKYNRFLVAYISCYLFVAIFGGISTWHVVATYQGPVVTVSFLDIGQGDSIAIKLPDDRMILIDAGRDGTVLNRLGAVMPWWKHDIDYLFVTHPDSDHYGGMFSVVGKYTIRHAYYNGDDDPDKRFDQLKSLIRSKHIPLDVVKAGDVFTLTKGVAMTILWPSEGFTKEDDNAASISFDLDAYGHHTILTADVPIPEEEKIMKLFPQIHAEVFKLGHHGSKFSSGADFLHALQPTYCIVSAGLHNVYHHPHPSTLARAYEIGCRILETAKQGTITFTETPFGGVQLAH